MQRRILGVGREFFYAFMFYYLVVFVSGSTAPLAIVVSGSMEPELYRGDIILTYEDAKKPLQVGEIVLFQASGKEIVHRIISLNTTDGSVVTKGDNNPVSDAQFLYKEKLQRKDVYARVWFKVPYLAKPFVWFLENPILKYGAIALSIMWDLVK